MLGLILVIHFKYFFLANLKINSYDNHLNFGGENCKLLKRRGLMREHQMNSGYLDFILLKHF